MIAGLSRFQSPMQKVLLLRGSLALYPLAFCPLSLLLFSFALCSLLPVSLLFALCVLAFAFYSFAFCPFYRKLMRLN